ncbi:MAG: Smr/MutS family protein [Spirochaetales bacterium]|nr:Smr/MutS family protein [Spirochaetales bacterium]
MDFGKILEQWERQEGQGAAGMAGTVGPGHGREDQETRRVPTRYQRLRKLPHQAEVDLHGLTAVEAELALERFLRDAAARGLGKVLIIHGKGNHTDGRPVLEKVVKAWLERSPRAGAFGPAERRHGGSGATWVILKG